MGTNFRNWSRTWKQGNSPLRMNQNFGARGTHIFSSIAKTYIRRVDFASHNQNCAHEQYLKKVYNWRKRLRVDLCACLWLWCKVNFLNMKFVCFDKAKSYSGNRGRLFIVKGSYRLQKIEISRTCTSTQKLLSSPVVNQFAGKFWFLRLF